MSGTRNGDTPLVCLASGSKQRETLLQQMCIPALVLPVDIDESRLADETARDYVYRLAMTKAQAGFDAVEESMPALGADTVVYNLGKVLGKPANEDASRKMLSELSGRTHEVLTGAGIVSAWGARGVVVSTRVTFAQLSPETIDAYWASGEPSGKAGAYGIQGIGGQFVIRLEGSYTNVVGLPLYETTQLLRFAHIDTVLVEDNRKET